MSRVDHHLEYSIMGMLGSFWSRVVSEKTKNEARVITSLASNAAGVRQLATPIARTSGAAFTVVERVRLNFLDGDFAVVGRSTTDYWRSALSLEDGSSLQIVSADLTDTSAYGRILKGADGRPLGMHLGHVLVVSQAIAGQGLNGTETRYVIPVPPGLYPVVIAGKQRDRQLVQGVDFESGDGYLVLRESPSELFSPGGMTVLKGLQRVTAPYDFVTQVNGPTYGSAFVTAYYRGGASLVAYERATAQAAGLLVLEDDDTLIQARAVSPGVTRYTFEKAGVIDVDYEHVFLNVGQTYPRGTIVSAGFELRGHGPAGWLRDALRGGTVSLDGVTPVSGLFLPPGLMTAYYQDLDVGGSPHARLRLQGSDAALEAFWTLQQLHELDNGVFLADFIGLTPGSAVVSFDMHAMLETFYGSRLLLLRPGVTGDRQTRMLEFAKREKPTGAALLINVTTEDTPGTGSLPAPGNYMPGEIEPTHDYSPPPPADDPSGVMTYSDALFFYDGAAIVCPDP